MTSTGRQNRRKYRIRVRAIFRKLISKPTRKKPESQLPPSRGKSFRTICLRFTVSLTQNGTSENWLKFGSSERCSLLPGESTVDSRTAYVAVPKGVPLKLKLRTTQGVIKPANTISAVSTSKTRRPPPNRIKKTISGMSSQPKAYRVSPPTPTSAPARPASSKSRPCPGFGDLASCSSHTRHQTSPVKISMSKMVESPETVKRQKSSVAIIKIAESQATGASNNRRERKKMRMVMTRNKSWLKRPIKKSG